MTIHENRPPDRRTFLTLGVGALAVATLPRALRSPTRLVRRRIPVMGTVAEVAVRHHDGAWAQRAIDAAIAELRRVETTMTRFRADSDVGRLNAAPGTRVAIGQDTAYVLEAALRWQAAAPHRFDPCLGPPMESVPGASGPTNAPGPAPSWGALVLEVDTGGSVPWACLHSAGRTVDLGGIGKGYAVDLAMRALLEHGVAHALANAGGDLAATGVDATGGPWRVGVRDPDDPGAVIHTLELADAALATSGLYFQGPHLLDPHTGAPVATARRSLTVEAATCLDADAAATAVYAAADDEGPDLLAHADTGARIVHSIQGGKPWTSA